jgi:hypothetical protein
MLIMPTNAYSCSFETPDKTMRSINKALVTVTQKIVYIVYFNLTTGFGQTRLTPGKKYEIH